MRDEEQRRVARVLYRWFVSPGPLNGHDVAHAMRVSYAELNHWATGRRPFPWWRLPDLLKAAPRPQLACDLLNLGAIGWTVVEVPAGLSATDVRRQAIRAVEHTTALVVAVDQAVAQHSPGGEAVTSAEAAEIRQRIEDCQREIATLGKAVGT